jgi:hypothetical protein
MRRKRLRQQYRTSHEPVRDALGGAVDREDTAEDKTMQRDLPSADPVSRIIEMGTIATETISKRVGKTAKTNQSWRYPGGIIARAASVTMPSGNTYYDPKAIPELLPRRKNESNFMVTINPNMEFSGPQDAIAREAMLHAFDTIFLDREFFGSIVKFGPAQKVEDKDLVAFSTGKPTGVKDGLLFYKDRCEDVVKFPLNKYQRNAEYGDKLKRLHVHALVFIEHYSQIQLNPHMLQYQFRELYNDRVKNTNVPKITRMPWVGIRRCPQQDWTDVYTQYLFKGMQQSEGRVGEDGSPANF